HDRQIEPAAALPDVGRGQVHGDPPQRPFDPAREQRGTDPVARLPARGVRQADDREPGDAARDVDLDGDGASVDAEHGGGRDGGDHSRLLATGAEEGRAPAARATRSAYEGGVTVLMAGACPSATGEFRVP